MFKAFRKSACWLAMLFVVHTAGAFSLIGPTEDYHITALGYDTSLSFGLLPPYRNAPKNLADEYRGSTPIVYYSMDAEFIDYFGSNGIVAIDGAYAILNSLANVSEYSSELTEFPLESDALNYSAAALNLLDLRTFALSVVLERYGLADPEQFTWNLRNRALPPGAECPEYEYSVIKRNYDPVTWEPSSYVNGNLFTYQIIELCPDPSEANASEIPVDPLATISSAVASIDLGLGLFSRGLTRDDVGGIRYLLSTNNLNWETTPDNSQVLITNQIPELLYSSNLQIFAEQALTNDAGELTALYPGLDVTSTSNVFVNVVETNVFAYLTNSPYDPVGSIPQLVFGTNFTTNVATRYIHTFGNVLTNEVYTNCIWSLLTTNIAPPLYIPPGSGLSVTNVTVETFVQTNCLSGSFFILPTNVCSYHILSTQLTQIITYTNFLTNTFTSLLISNATGSNVFDYYEYSQSILTYFTNSTYVAWPVVCPDSVTSLFQGIDRIQFVRRDYDSLLGQFFQPVTTNFMMVEVTNNTRFVRPVERTITAPDMLFTADDITDPPETPLFIFPGALVTLPNFVTASNNNVLGPGTITPNVTYTVNKVGPYYLNFGPAFLTEALAVQGFVWGSFDASTNAPIAYPVGTDLQSLEGVAVIQITEPDTIVSGSYVLPAATNGVAYSFQLEAVGGFAPYSWSLAPGSAGLPDGLSVSSAGLISGTPSEAGVFDFVIRITEAGARSVDGPMTLTVIP